MEFNINVSNNGPQIIILCNTMQICRSRSHEYTIFLHKTKMIIYSSTIYVMKLMSINY